MDAKNKQQGLNLMIDARLEYWKVDNYPKQHFFVLWGLIYDDQSGRFENATVIRTTQITDTQAKNLKPSCVVCDQNYRYVLGKKGKKSDIIGLQ